MNGFETTKKIKDLIKIENYINSIIISYSCNTGHEYEN